MGPVRETEAWYLSKETNKYTEYELLLVFTPLLVPPIGNLPSGRRAAGKARCCCLLQQPWKWKEGQRRVENRSGRSGNRKECAEGYGRGQISKKFRDEVAKRKCDSQYMMGIWGEHTWDNWVIEWLVLSMTDTGIWEFESGFGSVLFGSVSAIYDTTMWKPLPATGYQGLGLGVKFLTSNFTDFHSIFQTNLLKRIHRIRYKFFTMTLNVYQSLNNFSS